MLSFRSLAGAVLACLSCVAQTTPTTIEVGTGAPSQAVADLFVQAWYRNQFNALVASPPTTEVIRVGTVGLAQMFQDAAKTTGVRFALFKADANAQLIVGPSGTSNDVYQVLGTMWAYTASVNGANVNTPGSLNNTGFPTTDTALCTPYGDATCLYQLFDKKYALFVYSKAISVLAGQNFSIRDPFYTAWTAAGGVHGRLGPPLSAETAVTSPVSAAAATMQVYQQGALFNITSGTLNGRLISIREPVYTAYNQNGGYSKFLGYPISEEQVLPDGRFRQAFEGGAIEYATGQAPVLRVPVVTVQLSITNGPVRLRLGETISLTARLFGSDNREVTDRTVTWSTTNSRVVTVEGTGPSVTIRATGGGSANITATSEGKTSTALNIIVAAPCCQVGEGAPTASIERAFVDAVTRNRLALRLPAANPVRRVGAGFVQEFTGLTDPSVRYLLAVADGSAVAYYVTGAQLYRYELLGGPAGALGYPSSDPTPAGRQLFARAALAGNPTRLVTGPILEAWALAGFETGSVGSPTSESEAFLTFTSTAGQAQMFERGLYLSASEGPLAGSTFVVRGALLATYLELGSASGRMGMPSSEEILVDGYRRQEFEGGMLELAPGAAAVTVNQRERRPVVSATPNPVLAGSRVRLSVGGFAAGANLQVSVEGAADFRVSPASGAYAWTVVTPRVTRTTAVKIVAVDQDSGARAEGTYLIQSFSDANLRLTKERGDAQVGVPGAVLPVPLRIALRDESGVPISGVPVAFFASPGAAIVKADPVTNASGEAEAWLRMPFQEGVALATGNAGGKIVTFSARAAASNLPLFPRLTQNISGPLGPGPATVAESGSLLASVASILRYHQDRGELPVPNGPASVASLNQFLTAFCLSGTSSRLICDGYLPAGAGGEPVVNLWRVPAFAGGAVTPEVLKPEMDEIRDAVAAGSPVLVALSLSANGAPAGSHFVVVTGVAANSGLLIHDASGRFGRNSLNDFLSDFVAGGITWRGTIAAAVRFALAPAPASGFLITGTTPFVLHSVEGDCGTSLSWPARTVSATASGAPANDVFTQHYCSGRDSSYQLDVSAQQTHRLVLTDLGTPPASSDVSGDGPASYRLRQSANWEAVPQQAELLSGAAFLNAASLTADLAPGSLLSIFGLGLTAPTSIAEVKIAGVGARAAAGSGPFRLNVEIPRELSTGDHPVEIVTPFGRIMAQIVLREVAPAIFMTAGTQGLVTDEQGRAIRVDQPARRGTRITIFATGLGQVADNTRVATPVRVFIGDRTVEPDYVQGSVTMPGVYEVRVQVPSDLAPGSKVSLKLGQGVAESNTVEVAVE